MSVPIEKSLDDIRTEMFSEIAQAQGEYSQKGWLPSVMSLAKGIIRGMIELWCWGLHQLYLFMVAVLDQAFPVTATGLWLDLHCNQVGVTRRAATRASGTVYFYREDGSGNVIIPAASIVKTRPDGLGAVYRYVSDAEVILADGQTEVAVAVTAESHGAAFNVVVGQISELVSTINGVDGVRNLSDWLVSEGVDKEDDDSLRQRYWLAWSALNGCTAAAYRSWALDINGVVAATIMDQHPRGQGTVDVVLRGSAGLPTQALIDAVDANVQDKRPINDDALVKAPSAVPVAITGELELLAGAEPTVIVPAAENRLRALFSAVSGVDDVAVLEIGQDLTVALLTSVVMATGGIKTPNWQSPVADVTVPDDGLAVLDSLTLTWVFAAEQ